MFSFVFVFHVWYKNLFANICLSLHDSHQLADQPGLPVSGYAVFASGRMVTQIDSPSGDHALLSLTHLLNSRTITVRTKADTLLSADSLPCHIPEHVLKGKRLPPRVSTMLAILLTMFVCRTEKASSSYRLLQ